MLHTLTVLYSLHPCLVPELLTTLKEALLPAPAPSGLLYLDLPLLDISCEWSHGSLWPFVSGCLHLAQRVQGSSLLGPLSVLHAFL